MAGVDGTESPMEEDSADEGTAKSKTCIECKALKQSTEVRPPAPAGATLRLLGALETGASRNRECG